MASRFRARSAGNNFMPDRTILTKRRAHDAANEQAAQIILANVEKYGGAGSAQVQWARLVVERLEKECRT
jgi:hypothetical protein